MRIAHDIDALVLSAKDGSGEAVECLVEIYTPRLYGFVFRLTGHASDSEDLVQEVFLRLVKTLDSYDHDHRFEAWLFRIAVNLVRDRLRRTQRAPHVIPFSNAASDSSEDVSEPLDIGDLSEPAPDHRLGLDEEKDRLQIGLLRLPVVEREVIMLRHYSDMSFAEIAELMGTPLGTALARAHRGLAKLRRWMEE